MHLLLLGRRIEQEAKAEKHIQKLLLLSTHENRCSHYLNYFVFAKIISLLDEFGGVGFGFAFVQNVVFLISVTVVVLANNFLQIKTLLWLSLSLLLVFRIYCSL